MVSLPAVENSRSPFCKAKPATVMLRVTYCSASIWVLPSPKRRIVEVEARQREGAGGGARLEQQAAAVRAELEHLARRPARQARRTRGRHIVLTDAIQIDLSTSRTVMLTVSVSLQRSARARVAQVVGDDLQARRTGEVRRRDEGHAVQRRVDVGDGAGEGHGRRRRCRRPTLKLRPLVPGRLMVPLVRGERDLDGVAAGVDVADADLRARRAGEQHHAVDVGDLGARNRVDRRHIAVHDRDGDRVVVALAPRRCR